MEITLPWPPRVLHPNASKHWRAKLSAKKTYRDECFYITKTQIAGTISSEGNIPVSIMFHPPRNAGDIDGMLSACKNGLDGMCYALGINDKRLRPMTLMVGDKYPSGKIIVTLLK